MFEEHSRRLENDIDGELARRTFAKFKTGKVINYQAGMYTALVEYEGEARKMLNYAGRDLLDGEAVLFTSTPDGQELVLSAPNGPEGLPVDLGFVFELQLTGPFGGLTPTTVAGFTILGPANVTVNWGDGTSQVVIIPGATSQTVDKVYGDGRAYTASLSGTATRVRISFAGSLHLVRCTSFGVSGLTDMSYMFENCYHLTQVPDQIPATVTNMTRMFSGMYLFNQDLNTWDVSNVTNMSYMFRGGGAALNQYNGDISAWDVSNVTTMEGMFFESTKFNRDISSWDVSSVTNMRNMFSPYSPFNQPIGTWDVSSVTDMAGMFAGTPFNQPIGNWDISNVTDMAAMFSGNQSFNQDISTWDVVGVTNMEGMFQAASAFAQDITGWNVSNVTNMSFMFRGNTTFNQNISVWDVSSVTDMSYMFASTGLFNQTIGVWDVSNVTSMASMFEYAGAFNQNISGWDVANVTSMREMFANSYVFDQDIGGWDIGNVTDMYRMFTAAFGFSIANYDNLLVGWAALPAVQPNVRLDVNQNYTIAVSGTARGVLTGAPNNWTIFDDGGI